MKEIKVRFINDVDTETMQNICSNVGEIDTMLGEIACLNAEVVSNLKDARVNLLDALYFLIPMDSIISLEVNDVN